jgi:hypothetical protein
VESGRLQVTADTPWLDVDDFAAPRSIASIAVWTDTIDSSRHTGVARPANWACLRMSSSGRPLDQQQVELVELAQWAMSGRV